jgi:polyisoprenoid-binding protein YceI
LLWILLGLVPAQAAQAESPARRCSLSGQSSLGFSATWEGTVFRGHFSRFDAVIHFDPADLAASSFDVGIDVTTARTGSRERDEGMAEPDWFDFIVYPKARYRATDFQSLGDGQFLANGQLELKGVVHPVPVTFRWQGFPEKVTLDGGASISRLDFGIGQGDWATDEIIGLLVEVEFSLELVPCAAP